MRLDLAKLQSDFEALVARDPLPLPPPREAAPGGEAPAKPAGEAGAAPAPVAPPPPPPPPPPQVQEIDFAAKGFHFDARVQPTQVVEAAQIMDRHGFAMDCITGVDWLAEQQMEIVYDFFHLSSSCRAVVRVRVPRTEPALPTICGVFAGANWHERETAEFFGITFTGHPNLIPLLLPEDAAFHPLRKDFKGA